MNLEDPDPGLGETLVELKAMREQLGAANLMATFETEHGYITLVSDDVGERMLGGTRS